jgi:hypothetical protein
VVCALHGTDNSGASCCILAAFAVPSTFYGWLFHVIVIVVICLLNDEMPAKQITLLHFTGLPVSTIPIVGDIPFVLSQ